MEQWFLEMRAQSRQKLSRKIKQNNTITKVV
jgi:hypothetical protein